MIFYFINAHEDLSLRYQHVAREIHGITHAKLNQLAPLRQAFTESALEKVAKAFSQAVDPTNEIDSTEFHTALGIQSPATKKKLQSDLIDALIPDEIKPFLQISGIKEKISQEGTGKILEGYYKRYQIVASMASKVISHPTSENYHLMVFGIYLQHIGKDDEKGRCTNA